MKDKRPIRAIRRGTALVPYGAPDAEAFESIRPGEMVEVTFKRRRSLPQLHTYWDMLDKVVKATDAFPTAEHLHRAIKMDLGYFMPIKLLSGEVVLAPDSVAFEKMRAEDFRAYFAKAEQLIAERFGIDVAELRQAA